MEEEKLKVENSEELEKIKKGNKKFFIKFAIFLIILILITALAIYFTITYLEKNKKDSENILKNEVEIEEIKKTAEDRKYAINSYTETYDTNSLKISRYYDIDGKISTEDRYIDNNYQYHIQFIQIDGLKNKEIQNRVNERLKQIAYELKDRFVYTNVTANFSNILSVQCSNDNGHINTLNIDLSTGEDIPLEKVFVSSATINSYLSEGLYKTLAWQNLEVVDGEEVKNDMDKVDTSEYEDKFMMIINNYNNAKSNLKYNIYPSKISIYGLIDKNILDTDIYEQTSIEISLIEHMEEVAIYKRYLTKESIFETDNLGSKDIIVLTGDAQQEEYMTRISYGKISNNIFMEELLLKNLDKDDKMEVCIKYIEKLSEEQKEILKNQAYDNKGYFFQREYNIYDDSENDYYVINTYSYQAICSISYFENEAFKDYINLNATPRASVGLMGFSEYMKKDFPNLEILEEKTEVYYISKLGEFLGNTKEEVDRKRMEQQKLNEQTVEVEEIIQEVQQNNIQENIVNDVFESVDNEILEYNVLENEL